MIWNINCKKTSDYNYLYAYTIQQEV